MVVTNIADLRRLAYRRLPAIVFDYVDGGGYEEETLRRNRTDLEALQLRPRILNDVSHRSIETTILGRRVAMPLALAPVGACGLTFPNGEVHAAVAAERAGIPFCLSTLSIATIEDVAEATRSPFWFQLYLMRDKGVNQALVERAKAAGCDVLVLSLDLHVRSQRHRETKDGLTAPPRVGIGTIGDLLSHPRWLVSMAGSRRRTFGNLIGLFKDAKNVPKTTIWLEEQFDATLGAKDIEWARRAWPGKILVKGMLHPGDARDALAAGADGIVVSNHGGRQVDGAVSTAHALPEILEAAAGRGEVLVDSGIRSGIDMLKLLALGAHGCLVGRAYVYGLGAMGEAGVAKAIEILETELDQTMALCGATNVNRLPADLLAHAAARPASQASLR